MKFDNMASTQTLPELSPQPRRGRSNNIMLRYNETSSIYNRSWQRRSIIRCHSSLVQSMTEIPNPKNLLAADILKAFKAGVVSVDYHLPY